MPAGSLFILFAGGLVFGCWVLAVTPSLVMTLRRSLDRVTAGLSEPGVWPKVSIIVPARDEEARIEEAMRSKLRIDYPSLEFLAVDDRSVDKTGAILDRLS